MSIDDLDGCVYDTVPCCHSCDGCDYGSKECVKCGYRTNWPERLNDDNLCEECQIKEGLIKNE